MQIETVMEDFDIAAIKIGMLFNKEIIDTVKDIVKNISVPVVVDPVAVTNAGDKLLEDSALKSLLDLMGHASLITPNKQELKLFTGLENEPDATYIYTKCFDIYNFFGTKTLIKNYEESGRSSDYLIDKEGLKRFESRHIDSSSTHGSGCSFSSAITANLALGKSLEEAVQISKEYISKAIEKAPAITKCGGPLMHNLFRA